MVTPKATSTWSNARMKITRHIVALLALALAAATPLYAAEIYRWTDAEGNVHYGDRPTGDPSEERMHITYKRTDGSSIQARSQSRADSHQSIRDGLEERAEERKTKEEQRAEAAERQKKCVEYRGRLETMVTARRLYREDENGERVYLDDKQIDEARQRAEELVAEYCGS